MTGHPPDEPWRRAFVLRWGEIGRAWGLTRSAAQTHGLLLSSETALSAEEIAVALSVARSNVSASLKELRGLGLVRAAPGFGDRRERFAALEDAGAAAAALVAAHRARAIDPASAALAEAASAADGDSARRLAAYAERALTLGPMIAALAAAPEAHPKKKKKKK